MRAGSPAVEHGSVPGDFNTEVAEICHSRPGAKEQNGGRPNWACHHLLPSWRRKFRGFPI